MVSFWPWRSDDSSPASFEKALSSLSEKISKTNNRLDSLRQRSRRITGLWTLYSIFLYLLYTVILTLVVGWRSWGLGEYAAVAGGPFIFYLVRLGLTNYYHYRTSAVQGQLEDLQSQRDATIKKLKAATKYDTTQELLKKYGGSPTPKNKPSDTTDRKVTPKQGDVKGAQGSRTSFVPPPTANIPGRDIPSSPQGVTRPSVSAPGQRQFSPTAQNSPWQQHSPLQESAEFAPNAFPSPPQYAPQDDGPRWFDRVMDLLMGEDETLPGKRLALICGKCRLVNGQAPPGTQRLEDVGKWRCAACGAMNGEESEMKKIVASIKKQDSPGLSSDSGKNVEVPSAVESKNTTNKKTGDVEDSDESDITQYSSTHEKDEEETHSTEETTAPRLSESPRRSARNRKGRKLKA